MEKERNLRLYMAIMTIALAALAAPRAMAQDVVSDAHPLASPTIDSTIDLGYFPPTLAGIAVASISNDGLPGSILNLAGYSITGTAPSYFDIANWDAIYKELSVGQATSPCPLFVGSPTPGVYQADITVWTDAGDVIWHVRAGTAYPGDANLDGAVTFSDYQLLEAGFGSGTTWAQGDFNGNRHVTFADYQMLEANFGKQVVPDPASLSFLLAGCVALAIRKHRSRG